MDTLLFDLVEIDTIVLSKRISISIPVKAPFEACDPRLSIQGHNFDNPTLTFSPSPLGIVEMTTSNLCVKILQLTTLKNCSIVKALQLLLSAVRIYDFSNCWIWPIMQDDVPNERQKPLSFSTTKCMHTIGTTPTDPSCSSSLRPPAAKISP